MIDLLTLSIGIGLAVSLTCSETLRRGAGGLVVPGYLALYLTRPIDIGLTLLTALATFAVVYGLSSYLIVFGKRRTVLMILIGFVLGAVVRGALGRIAPADASVELTVIGYIIPGLLAIWFDRQGIVDTCSTALTAAVVTRLILVLVASSQLQQWEMERMPAAPAALPMLAEPTPQAAPQTHQPTAALRTTAAPHESSWLESIQGPDRLVVHRPGETVASNRWHDDGLAPRRWELTKPATSESIWADRSRQIEANLWADHREIQ